MLLNDKRIDSFGVSKIDLGLILIVVCVSLHGDTSNFNNISASPVFASIIANRIPTYINIYNLFMINIYILIIDIKIHSH